MLIEQNVRAAPMNRAAYRWNRRLWVGIGSCLLLFGLVVVILGVIDERLRPAIALGAIPGVFGLLAFFLAWRLPRFSEKRTQT
jgi:hypothetical protein